MTSASWTGVTYVAELPPPGEPLPECDLAIVDCPPLLDPTCTAVLNRCRGVVLTCQAEPLALRTIPAAAQAIERARLSNAQLEFLGVVNGLHRNEDLVQAPMLDRLRAAHGDRLVLYEAMEVHSWAWIFFISFVLLASLLVINILIAIIINAMEDALARDVRVQLPPVGE